MANTDLRANGEVPAVTNSQNVGTGGRVHVYKITVDLSVNNVANTDTLQLFTVKAGQALSEINFNVTTVEGAILTFNLGDGTTAAKYVAAGNLNAAGRVLAAAASSDFLTADGVITLTALAAGSTAVVDFWVKVTDYV